MWMGLVAWLPAILPIKAILCLVLLGLTTAPAPFVSALLGTFPLLTLTSVCFSTPQTLCEQLRQENEALKSKLDKGLEQRDQAAERLR